METTNISHGLDGVVLHYFPVNGRAGVIRCILQYGKVPYTDNNIPFTEWPAHKTSGKHEFGCLPTLEVNGNNLSQTVAICIYLSRKLNLLGSSAEDEYQIISLFESFEDIIGIFRSFTFPQPDEEKKKAFIEKTTPLYLTVYENRLKKNGGKYFVGDSLSFADIGVTYLLHHLYLNEHRREEFEPLLKQWAPTVYELIERLKKNELSEYFTSGYVKGPL